MILFCLFFNTDIDECSEEEWNDCHEHADCKDNTGSYSCTCKDGFTGDGVEACDGEYDIFLFYSVSF